MVATMINLDHIHNPFASSEKPKNPVEETVKRGGFNRERTVMNLKSTGYGPSKLNADESMPKLGIGERAILAVLNGTGPLAQDDLTSRIEPPFTTFAGVSTAIATIDQLIKTGYLHRRSNGTVVLMAEGRRVASLLEENSK